MGVLLKPLRFKRGITAGKRKQADNRQQTGKTRKEMRAARQRSSFTPRALDLSGAADGNECAGNVSSDGNSENGGRYLGIRECSRGSAPRRPPGTPAPFADAAVQTYAVRIPPGSSRVNARRMPDIITAVKRRIHDNSGIPALRMTEKISAPDPDLREMRLQVMG